MWPVPLPSAAPSAMTWRAAASTTGQGATHRAGSKLPWTAWSAPTRVRATSSGTRQSTPITSAPAVAIRLNNSPVPTPKRMEGTPRSAIPSSTVRVAGSTKRTYSAGERLPAQLSKSCTACTPASICARRKDTDMAAKLSMSWPQSTGSPCMSAFTLVNVREGPPSIR